MEFFIGLFFGLFIGALAAWTALALVQASSDKKCAKGEHCGLYAFEDSCKCSNCSKKIR